MARSDSSAVLPVAADLDSIDFAVLSALLQEPRASVRRISASTNIPYATVRNRLEALLSSQTARIVGLVEPSAVGKHVTAFVWVTARGHVTTVAEAITELDDSRWVAIVDDYSTVASQVSVASNEDLLELLDELRATVGVTEVRANVALRSSFSSRFIDDRISTPIVAAGDPWLTGATQPQLDEIDLGILTELQKDGRVSFTRLGELVGLSTAAARQRYLNLVRARVVRVQCRLDPDALGFHALAGVGITVTGNARATALAVTDIPASVWITEVAGDANIYAEILCRTRGELGDAFAQIVALSTVTDARMTVFERVMKASAIWA